MDDEEFLTQVQRKIERLSGREIKFILDDENELSISVDWSREPPRVSMSTAILKYPGLARMGIEYAVASLRAGRLISPEEFEVLLRRN